MVAEMKGDLVVTKPARLTDPSVFARREGVLITANCALVGIRHASSLRAGGCASVRKDTLYEGGRDV